MGQCDFNTLFALNVHHILEEIFFYLDYASYRTCMEVSKVWCELLTSKSFLRLGITHFGKEIGKELWWAVKKNNVIKVRRIISTTGINVNFKLHRETPLWLASRMGYTDVVKHLLQAGADANEVPTKRGWSLLYELVPFANCKVLSLLLLGGAEVNKQTMDRGKTPLHVAASVGRNPEAVEVLLDMGADPNVADHCGWTPLHLAILFCPSTIVEMLLNKGAETHHLAQTLGKFYPGGTALHMATKRGLKDKVRLLIDAGAEINIRDQNGKTPLAYPLKRGYTAIVNLLTDNGGTL